MRVRYGMGLVEVLVVVVLLGVVAYIALPRYSSAAARGGVSVEGNVQSVRSMIELFKMQHNGVPPQAGGMAGWGNMLGRSERTETNVAGPTGGDFGPYFESAPVNPFNKLSNTSTVSGVDTTSGWYYTAEGRSYTLQVRNADGSVNTAY